MALGLQTRGRLRSGRERGERTEKESSLSIEEQRITEPKPISEHKTRQRTMAYIQHR